MDRQPLYQVTFETDESAFSLLCCLALTCFHLGPWCSIWIKHAYMTMKGACQRPFHMGWLVGQDARWDRCISRHGSGELSPEDFSEVRILYHGSGSLNVHPVSSFGSTVSSGLCVTEVMDMIPLSDNGSAVHYHNSRCVSVWGCVSLLDLFSITCPGQLWS